MQQNNKYNLKYLIIIFLFIILSLSYTIAYPANLIIDTQEEIKCTDFDNDGYGTKNLELCQYKDLDCDDNNNTTNPGSIEVCDNDVDENCDTVICNTSQLQNITNPEVNNNLSNFEVNDSGSQNLRSTTGQTIYYYGLNGNLEITNEDNEIKYWQSDLAKNTRVVYDNNGDILFKQDYYPFGLDLQNNGPENAKRKYISKERDSTNFYYVENRFYDPESRRFLSKDKITSEESPYVYALNNPINYLDSNGLLAQPAIAQADKTATHTQIHNFENPPHNIFPLVGSSGATERRNIVINMAHERLNIYGSKPSVASRVPETSASPAVNLVEGSVRTLNLINQVAAYLNELRVLETLFWIQTMKIDPAYFMPEGSMNTFVKKYLGRVSQKLPLTEKILLDSGAVNNIMTWHDWKQFVHASDLREENGKIYLFGTKTPVDPKLKKQLQEAKERASHKNTLSSHLFDYDISGGAFNEMEALKDQYGRTPD